MPNITLPPADKPIGWAEVNGRLVPVYPDRTWLQKLEELVRKLNELGG